MSNMTAVKSSSAGSTLSENGQEERSNVPFPWRLHELLSEAEKNGNDSVISWLPDKNAFKVHNKIRFATEILPAHFNATKYKSFQRNLNLWGFETITEGPHKGGCFHPLFVRGDREKCHYMTRQKVKGNKLKQDSPNPSQRTPETEDNESKRAASLSTLANLASKAPSANSNFARLQQLQQDLKQKNLKRLPFVRKLHHILAQPEYGECIRWTPDGRCIRVVDPFRFQEKISLKYFSHSSFSSFLVELESYGFKKVTHSGFQECYYHDLMIRGCHHLCKYMSSPEDSRLFVSTDPMKDLNMDPHLSSSLSTAATAPTSRVSTQLAAFQSADAAFQQLHLQQRQQQLAGISPLYQILSGGGAADSTSLSFQLGSLNSQILGVRGASLPGYVLSGSEGQNRSAIANFLANPQLAGMSGEFLLRGAGNGATLRNP